MKLGRKTVWHAPLYIDLTFGPLQTVFSFEAVGRTAPELLRMNLCSLRLTNINKEIRSSSALVATSHNAEAPQHFFIRACLLVDWSQGCLVVSLGTISSVCWLQLMKTASPLLWKLS